MAKAFFGAFLLLFGLVLWISLPRAMKKPCPVCQGTGLLESRTPIVVGKGREWVEKKELLCPFCVEGKISLYELKLHRLQMIRWMVKEQKLEPEVLVKRVREGFGEEGLSELDRSHFFMDEKSQSLNGGTK